MLATLSSISAAPAFGLTASSIPALTVTTEVQRDYIVNGAFATDQENSALTFTATLANGSALPSWINLNSDTGIFSVRAPTSARGQVHQVRVTATDAGGAKTSVNFYIAVDDESLGCTLDANTDRLARMLNCTTGKARLRGYSSTNSYRWTGPNGFTSSSQEPDVTVPGLYTLTTGEGSCARKQVVEVKPAPAGCKETDKNVIPVAKIDADRFSGQAPLTLTLDGLLSYDSDGSVIEYEWSWEGTTAAGPTPTATFEAGTHKVILTVTDNTGAKSTDYVTIEVTNSDHVRYRSYWLEAECATVGSKWSVGSSGSASEGKYVYSKNASTSSAPSDVPENQIRFTLTNAEAGNYYLFARIDAATNADDSYWVRVNGKSWYEWNTGIISGQGFQWNEMMDFQAYLTEGTNTIDFAFREADARLDKVHLNKQNAKPSGNGDAATNCYAPANVPPVAVASASTYSGTAPLTLTLDGSGSTDKDGKIVSYDWSWNGGSASGINKETTFPTGTYKVTLTVKDDDGATGTNVITVQVADDVAAKGGNSIWLEAECGTVGSIWAVKKSTAASGGTYVVPTGSNAYNEAPSDVPNNRVRFTFNSPATSKYKLFARINAPTNGDDSYWVRINGGSWIKWYSGITQGGGFTWNRLPGDAFQLTAGSNTIDFAYRENGAMLDKLYLTDTNSTPSGEGGSVSNCQATETVYTQYLEAECAKVGSGWNQNQSSGASNGKYVVFSGNNITSEPSATDLSQQVQFTVDAAGSGTFYLFLRLDAPDLGSNSLWVKFDDGKWMRYWTEVGGDNLLTNGFEWRRFNNDGKEISFNVNAGNHTVTIANRETGTKLDKIAFSRGTALPPGMGGQAANCGTTSQSMTNTSMSVTQSTVQSESVETAEGVTVYPNPAVEDLNVSLNSTYEGAVQVTIIDVNGRELSTSTHDKVGENLSIDLNVRNLPSGMYRLRIIEGENQRVQPFVRL
ncbi:PKD domain-containing protein [Neolewinella litorea]|uniref:PKD domain-containing protein n=1 Tax=Neolewinella litorea TaxID=2562452 RepID=UPI001455F676|nr:PKD domain-containing protein [Neolewinella litorea]